MERDGNGADFPVIDVHAHLVPQVLIDRLAKRPAPGVAMTDESGGRFAFALEGAAPTRPLPPRLIDVDRRVTWMNEQGIDLQIVATWADIFGYAMEPGRGTEWSRILNDTLLEAVSGSNRFAALATLPMQNPEDAAVMTGEALDDGFVGVTIAARIGDVELDHPSLRPFWEAASDRDAIVFIHPGYSPDDRRTADYGMVNVVGRTADTTIAATRLLGAGIPDRYPRLKIMLAHGGGALPFILGRLIRNHQIDPQVGDPQKGFARLLFDTAVFDQEALCYLVSRAAPGAVMLGSDYPFPIGDPTPLEVVERATCLSDGERRSVLGRSAQQKFGVEAP
jgi:aminocarboxymuconate-semialdehyde decarboxylase